LIMLACNNITKSFGVESILDNISFQLKYGDRVGVVGINGAGKSTLFRILAGVEHSDSGSIILPGGSTIGYLQQQPCFDKHQTLSDLMLENFSDLRDIEAQINELETRMSVTEGPALDRLMQDYGNLSEEFKEKGGYSYKSIIKGALRGLGLGDEYFNVPVGQLSGGQQTRAALAQLLLKKHSVILLDEPTNYLDIAAVEWLEGFLAGYDGSVMVISHDRYFLDRICNRIFEIRNTKLYEYQGNYSDYVVQKDTINRIIQKEYSDKVKEIDRQKEIIRRLKSFNREKSVRRAKSREKAVDRMELPQKPDGPEQKVRIKLEPLLRSGRDVLLVEDVSMSFGSKTVFDGVNLRLYRGEIIGIIGPNGIGKTTLLRIVSGELVPTSGRIYRGHNVNIEYYHQQQEDLNQSNTVIDEIWNQNPGLDNTAVRDILAAFLFQGDDVYKTIGDLSGGEKSRVALIKLMLSKANLLLLDEPTNHLDTQSREVLEEALIDYTGTVLVISHDRYFLDRVATKIAELTRNGINIFHGNYSYYRMKKAEEEEQKSLQEDDNGGPTRTSVKLQRKKEREEREARKRARQKAQEIEQAIIETEQRISELEDLLCKPEVYSDHEKSVSIHMDIIRLKETLDHLYNLWGEL
jgi:ATP-binding cassette subfamily F protein 3